MPIQIVNVINSQERLMTREVWSELDSHADTCVVGKHALVFQDFDRPVDVIEYDKQLGVTKNYRTVGAAVAYSDLEQVKQLYSSSIRQPISQV